MKVLLLGFDALDRLLLEKLSDYLPNIAKMKKDGVFLPVLSTFPPDSDTAWATIYTALNPAEHGVVDFVDPLDKSMKIQHTEKDNTNIKNRTFWDIAGKNGKKICEGR